MSTADTLLKLTPHHIIGGVIGKEDEHRHEFQGGNVSDTPADPADLDGFELYWKKIDDNNNGLFIKGKKNGVIIEGQIF